VFCGGVVLSYSGLEFLHLQSNIFFFCLLYCNTMINISLGPLTMDLPSTIFNKKKICLYYPRISLACYNR
jgi:hypothetical protein